MNFGLVFLCAFCREKTKRKHEVSEVIISTQEACSDNQMDSGETFHTTGRRDMSYRSKQVNLLANSDDLFFIANNLFASMVFVVVLYIYNISAICYLEFICPHVLL